MSGTLSLRIRNFCSRALKGFAMASTWTNIGNFNWRIVAAVDKYHGTSYLGMGVLASKSLVTGDSDGEVWSVKATLSIRVAGRHRTSNVTSMFYFSSRDTTPRGQINGDATIVELDVIRHFHGHIT